MVFLALHAWQATETFELWRTIAVEEAPLAGGRAAAALLVGSESESE